MPATNCHFCELSEEELVTKEICIVRSPNKRHRICQECATKISLFAKDNIKHSGNPIESDLNSFTPISIFNKISESVLFQDDALRCVSLAIYQHIQRISGNYNNKEAKVSKNNILLSGPSGTGKTAIIKEVEGLFDFPVIETNANSITSSGYVGRDATDIIYDLYIEAGEDIENTERGIVFIDEIDKIRNSSSGGKDINGGGVQESLLKLMEGTKVHLNYPDKDIDVIIDTSNILFICAGAFSGIAEIHSKNKQDQSIGFGSSLKTSSSDFDYSKLEHSDFVAYGFMEEFLGRLPVLASLSKLTIEQYQDMLTLPKNSLFSQIKVIFENENATFEWTDEALLELSKEAMKKNLGARGARNILSKAIDNKLFEISSDTEDHIVVLKYNKGEFILDSESKDIKKFAVV